MQHHQWSSLATGLAGVRLFTRGIASILGRRRSTPWLLREHQASREGPYEGKHYQLGRTLSSPQSISTPRPYLMIGGGGELKTLRMVAQYADACNIGESPESAHKLDVLRQHCDTVGRDYNQIEKTALLKVNPDTTKDDLVERLLTQASNGYTVAYIYSTKIAEPGTVVDLLASALPEIAEA